MTLRRKKFRVFFTLVPEVYIKKNFLKKSFMSYKSNTITDKSAF